MNIFLATVAVFLGGTAVSSGSSIIFSNLQVGSLKCGCTLEPGDEIGSNPDWAFDQLTVGNPFTIPTTAGFTLDSIELAVGFIAGPVNALSVFLYSDLNDAPGALMESWEIDSQMGPIGKDHTVQTAESDQHPVLEAGATYWVLTTTTDPSSQATWYSATQDGSVLIHDSFYSGSQISCCVHSGRFLDAFAILGTPLTASTSEPSALWMGMIGITIMFLATLSGPYRLALQCSVTHRNSGRVRSSWPRQSGFADNLLQRWSNASQPLRMPTEVPQEREFTKAP